MFSAPIISQTSNPDRHSVYLHARVVILKLQRGICWIYAWRHNHAINERAINRRAINDYMERLHPMMKYGNFIEVYHNCYFTIFIISLYLLFHYIVISLYLLFHYIVISLYLLLTILKHWIVWYRELRLITSGIYEVNYDTAYTYVTYTAIWHHMKTR